ncbi:zinc finger MYM-type protein 6 [Trichonephila clavipes]|uniref:Zinc finger MYM-type protein 6 n=1 Tax=Trichonephila clavipes TaxID=2585209 RepID=A0A8X6SME1_TRICX|nr:zinc finger MYM-type protein 6 [Trichonephila clavipes]
MPSCHCVHDLELAVQDLWAHLPQDNIRLSLMEKLSNLWMMPWQELMLLTVFIRASKNRAEMKVIVNQKWHIIHAIATWDMQEITAKKLELVIIGGGDRWCCHLSYLRGISPSKFVLSPVWCSRPRSTTGVLLAPYHDEFRGPRSDYVRQVALATTTHIWHSRERLLRCKKPHTIAEELILPAAIEIVENMFGDNFAKELQSISLSNDTVSRRIDDIAEDVEQQLFGKLRDKLFSIQLDEATDSNKDAHFIAYVRFWDGMSAVEEILFCKPIKLKATAIALFDILNNFINEANIEWKNCVGICSDGARTMSGRFKSIQRTSETKISTVHLDTLHDPQRSSGFQRNESWSEYCANDSCDCSKLHKNDTPKIKNLSGLCKDMDAVHSSLLFYCEARWLSRGKFLQRFYELRNKITIFLEEENLPEAEKFRDGLFMMK